VPLRLLLLVGLVSAACDDPRPSLVYRAIPVERRDILVSAEAAGTIEPHVTVEVKSEAAGEILDIRVETGERVERGTLMVRIDQRHPRNALARANADLEVARARLANVESQKRRAEELFKTESISETEYDQALLDHANAKAEVIRARIEVENARIEMDDTDIRAPITGTIIERNVETGQVISSPTRDVGEGTLLLKMADLSRVQVRTLVDETDIGKIRPDLRATVTVAAYPSRPFDGAVLKIEPQAVTEQNVTMFPVLVGIENPEGLLKPGMNCEVEVHVDRRDGVLAIPNSALRTLRDVGSAARVLGLSEEGVHARLAASEPATGPADSHGAEGGDPAAAPGRTGGDRYIVFVLRQGAPQAVHVRTGLSDLDYSEVLAGLSASDSVLVLPSAGLVRSQEQRSDRIKRITGGGLPGLRSKRP
jgi:HlyD family secretion protein